MAERYGTASRYAAIIITKQILFYIRSFPFKKKSLAHTQSLIIFLWKLQKLLCDAAVAECTVT